MEAGAQHGVVTLRVHGAGAAENGFRAAAIARQAVGPQPRVERHGLRQLKREALGVHQHLGQAHERKEHQRQHDFDGHHGQEPEARAPARLEQEVLLQNLRECGVEARSERAARVRREVAPAGSVDFVWCLSAPDNSACRASVLLPEDRENDPCWVQVTASAIIHKP